MTSGRHTRTGIQGLGCSDPIKQCKHHCKICSTQQHIHRTRKKSLALIWVKVSILCNTENNGIHQLWRRAYWDFVIWTLLTPHTQKLHALHQKSKRTYIYISPYISIYKFISQSRMPQLGKGYSSQTAALPSVTRSKLDTVVSCFATRLL